MKNDDQKTITEFAIMTVADVADYLRISEAKIYKLAREGTLPAIRIGKTWRFRRELLDAWLDECSKNEGHKPLE